MNSSVKSKKRSMGLVYGLVAGGAFAFFAWGIDAFLLARANASYPWVKFFPGFLLCMVAGGVVGLLTMHFEKHGFALIVWGLFAGFCSWLAVWISYTGSQLFLLKINPGLGQYFNFKPLQDMAQYRLFSLAVIGLAAIISGLLEINLVQQASTSSNYSSILMAVLIGIFLFGLAGSATDQMINVNLREPVQIVNKLIQFAADNNNTQVPKETARKLHLSAVRQLGNLVQKERQLVVIGYDQGLGIIDILVDFEGTLTKCTTIYAQPLDCTILTLNP